MLCRRFIYLGKRERKSPREQAGANIFGGKRKGTSEHTKERWLRPIFQHKRNGSKTSKAAMLKGLQTSKETEVIEEELSAEESPLPTSKMSSEIMPITTNSESNEEEVKVEGNRKIREEPCSSKTAQSEELSQPDIAAKYKKTNKRGKMMARSEAPIFWDQKYGTDVVMIILPKLDVFMNMLLNLSKKIIDHHTFIWIFAVGLFITKHPYSPKGSVPAYSVLVQKR